MENLPKELQLEFVDESTGEENSNFVYTDEPELQDEPLPEVEHLIPEKMAIELNDIFDEKQNPILPESEDVGGLDTEAPQISVVKEPKKTKEKPVKLNKNGQPRKKRQYTEEQRQAMRERMLKVREMSGKNKQKKQEQKAKEQKYKELMEKKKELEMEEVEEKLKKKAQPKTEKPKPPPPQPALTKQDIKDIQLEAIMQYDGLRKQRKAKKKQEQQAKEYNENVKKQLKKELGWKDIAGEYANCF